MFWCCRGGEAIKVASEEPKQRLPEEKSPRPEQRRENSLSAAECQLRCNFLDYLVRGVISAFQ